MILRRQPARTGGVQRALGNAAGVAELAKR